MYFTRIEFKSVELLSIKVKISTFVIDYFDIDIDILQRYKEHT